VWLPGGLRRSYGDVGQNAGHRLIDATSLDRFIAFDRETGVLKAEAGVSLADIIQVSLPLGWFLPTNPGTQFVTIGGAIACDVHGKNHHRAGSFGRSVRSFELMRSDGSRRICSLENEKEFFQATIGGLGLTGLITWAEIQLVRVGSAYIDSQDIAYSSLDDFFALAKESEGGWEHTVAWFDCTGKKAGRGIFSRGNWRTDAQYHLPARSVDPSVPFDIPSFALNALTVATFNAVYYRVKKWRAKLRRMPYPSVLFPLDGIGDWNRLYGPRGFYQYQCLIPPEQAREAIRSILDVTAGYQTGSFLAVLKTFGDLPSPGLLSFPKPGTTLALDFPNKGEYTLALFRELDAIVAASGGRIYAAKDARMPASLFQSGYPNWRQFAIFKDPAVQSDFWSRVSG
jgi:L-gulonolactone oxidase